MIFFFKMNEKGNYYSEKEYSILMKESEKPLKTVKK